MTNGGINEKTGKWCKLGYFPYRIVHKNVAILFVKDVAQRNRVKTEEMKVSVGEMLDEI